MAMKAAAVLLRRTTNLHHRALSTCATEKPYHHHDYNPDHVYLKPTPFIGSFLKDDTPKNPKEAYRKLALLRRDYDKQVKVIRKEFIEELNLKQLEKARKDEASKAELLRLREERKKLKAAAAVVRAAERKASDEEFRLTLAKEKAEKLKYWRRRQNAIEKKKIKKRELICQQSAQWIAEEKLEPKILEAVMDSKVL
ncbi:uncharacterized protein LOC141592612 [Silene latifolia]|uniref:uncharacterized protein LOC141592612 n=1 Tax=Silene latifolia TaxID=37657 RepID=UPI003D788034